MSRHVFNQSGIARASVLVMGCVTLAGCQTWNTLEAQTRVDPISPAGYNNAGNQFKESVNSNGVCDVVHHRGDFYAAPVNLDCFTFPDSDVLAYERAVGDKSARNRLASVLMKYSDDVCAKELGDLNAREAFTNAALGTGTSALSTLASIVTGERAKSWLAGGATLTNATRDHINSEIFRNVVSTAIAKAIQNDRDEQMTALKARFGESHNIYTVDEMIADVNRYHHSCSYYNGLALVVEAVNRPSAETAVEYRDKTAAIADLTAQIDVLNQRIAASGATDADKTAYRKLRDQLETQRTKLIIERSQLSSSRPEVEEDNSG